jgi:hypothetical protein
MSDDKVTLSFAVPIDSDGFMRRECPTCERELKWKGTSDAEDETPTPDGGYYCPYCRIQGPTDAWWTKEQLEHAKTIAYREIVAPQIDNFAGPSIAQAPRALSVCR